MNQIRSFLKKYILPITPISILEVYVILLNRNIRKFLEEVKINGDVLDMGAQKGQYKKYVKARKYLTLDLELKYNPDICCDAHNITCEDNRFEMVIATELLEHCYNPQQVVDEIYRVLEPGGICLISVPFMYHYHIAPGVKDYYRFSKDGLRYMFRKFSNVEIKGLGNRFQLVWDNINSGNLIFKFFLNIFNPLIALMNTKNSNYSFGYILTAKKQGDKNE